MWIIILFQLLIIVLLAVYINDLVVIEKFTAGYGTTFGHFIPPIPACTNETNCFKGFESRDSIYTNICEPIRLKNHVLGTHHISDRNIDIHYKDMNYDKILITKRPLQEECIRVY